MPIAWDESLPTDSEQFSGFPARTKSLKTSFALAISNSLVWPGSGGGTVASAGSVKAGTARAYYDVQSNFSAPSSVSSGAVYITSDTSRLFGGGSNLTMFLGSTRLVEAEAATTGQRVHWRVSTDTAAAVDDRGTFRFGGSDQTTFTVQFTNGNSMPFDFIAPIVDYGLWLETSPGTGTVQGATVYCSSVTTGGATFVMSVLSRRTTFPSVPSVCTAHLLVMSRGTVSV